MVPAAIIGVIGLLASVITYIWIQSQSFQVSLGSKNIVPLIQEIVGMPGEKLKITFEFILWNNLRAIFIISLLGIFSFGVLGVMAYLVNVVLIGGLLSVISLVGYSPGLVFVSGILPHGIFEIPALILSGATVLYIGAALVKPTPERTLGEVVIEAIADWAKIMVGLVVPMLIIAAAIETWITPKILVALLVK
jgi:uncharacterized membrane protein SpoIIM required for sporulation